MIRLPSSFRGRVFQVLDSLDYGDAVCNHAMNLNAMLHAMGVETRIHTTWFHESMGAHRSDLRDLTPNDEDIVVMHVAGFSDHAWPFFKGLRCTRVCLYHNITPQGFFPKGSELYEFCRKGRDQLPEIVANCHYFWAVSNYNLKELMALGAPSARCATVPIVVEPIAERRATSTRQPGTWLFVGRLAANKCHARLLKLFATVRRRSPDLARKLYLVGGYDGNGKYFAEVRKEIEQLGLGGDVVLTGKVSDAVVESHFASASVYVSVSEHEGFGVPLIEAADRGLPVVALDTSGVGETMGQVKGLIGSDAELVSCIVRVLGDADFRDALLAEQELNARRFRRATVQAKLVHALMLALPERGCFTRVSVVVCTYNRRDMLERCLDYLQYQTHPQFEVVVVNGPSDDGTEELLRSYGPAIKVVLNPLRNLAVSRNLGIEASAGQLIAFIDDDALPFDDWVETLLREFNARPLTLAALGGPAYFAGTLDFQDQDIGINRFAETRRDIDASEIGHNGWERSLLGTNTCFRADMLSAVQGFDEQFDYFLDESELSLRLQIDGHIVGYCPDLYLRHEFAQSHNRSGRYRFNWFTICKNTAYFVSAYSGLKGRAVENYLSQRMSDERLAWLKAAVAAGELSTSEYEQAARDIARGVKQGLVDARSFPRRRAVQLGEDRSWTPFPLAEVATVRPHRRLHVCIVTQEFPPFTASGGIGTLYYNLASELLLMGHRVSVLLSHDQDDDHRRGRFLLRKVRRRRVCDGDFPAPGFFDTMNWSACALHAVAALHVEEPIDVIDSALWDSEALLTALLPKGDRPPVVVRLVTPFPVAARLNEWNVLRPEYDLFCSSERHLIANADAVVPISESIAATVEAEHHIVRDARWQLSYCGIAYWPSFDSRNDYAALESINGNPFTLPVGAKIVLFVGRLEGRKGVDDLLAASQPILQSDPVAHIVLAGRDVDDFRGRFALELTGDLQTRVHVLGQVDDASRDKLLHHAHCVVFPSRYESFGLVPLEAFVHAVPVVAARTGAIPEVVTEDCGLLFEPGDASQLAMAVCRLLSDPDLRERLSNGARRRIKVFGSRASARRAEGLYHALVARGVQGAQPVVAQVDKAAIGSSEAP